MYGWDSKKYDKLRKKYFGDESQVWNSPDADKTKRFLEDYLEEEIDGFRVVRFTNLSNGNPIWRLDTYKKSPNSPVQEMYSGEEGPLVEDTKYEMIRSLIDAKIVEDNIKN
jgi:hypothetical protein